MNIARIAKVTLHKVPKKLSLNVSFVCPVCPIAPRLNLQVLESRSVSGPVYDISLLR